MGKRHRDERRSAEDTRRSDGIREAKESEGQLGTSRVAALNSEFPERSKFQKARLYTHAALARSSSRRSRSSVTTNFEIIAQLRATEFYPSARVNAKRDKERKAERTGKRGESVRNCAPEYKG